MKILFYYGVCWERRGGIGFILLWCGVGEEGREWQMWPMATPEGWEGGPGWDW